jgi:thiosulfate/3-mercaptopyruvate sulfurtransferase
LIDARFSDVFKKGHIPTSTNVPFSDLLEADQGKFKSPEEIKKIFQVKGQLKNPETDTAVLTCQLGISACVLDAALR